MRVIHKHIHNTFKNQFMQKYRPFKVWNALKARFDNRKTILHP